MCQYEKDTDKKEFEHWDLAKNFEDLHMVSDVVLLWNLYCY